MKSRNRILCVAITQAVISSGLFAQALVVPQPDVRVTVPFALLSNAVARFDGVMFEGEVDVGRKCDGHLELQKPTLSASGWTRFVDGAGSFQGGLTAKARAFTNDGSCTAASIDALIAAKTCLNTFDPVMTTDGTATLLGLPIALPLRFPNPLRIVERQTVRLEKIESTAGLDLKLEFGDFIENKWVVSQNPTIRTVFISPTLRGLGGNPLPPGGTLCEGYNEGGGSVRTNASHLAADLSFARPTMVRATTIAEANKILDSIGGSPDGIEVNISPRVIGDGNPGVGILGSILPMQLSGSYEYAKGEKLNFAIALESGRAEFRKVDGGDALLVGFRLTPVRIWTGEGDQGTERSATHLVATMVVDLPLPDEKGVVKLHVREFGVGFQAAIGSAHVCVNAKLLENAFKIDPVVIAIAPDISIALPDCVDVGNDRVNAARPCADGKGDRGRLSNNHVDRNTTLHVDMRKPRVNIKDGRLSIVVPVHE